MHNATVALVIHILINALVIVRVLLRSHRAPAARVAWIAVIASLPVLGILAYILFGEVNIGRRRAARLRQVIAGMPAVGRAAAGDEVHLRANIPEQYRPLFRVGHSISGSDPVGGNSARLLENSNVTIDEMVADIDRAQDHVHLLFYIWLADNNGLKVVEALKRAAGRGTTCRAMVDGLGSRRLVRSRYWAELKDTGVRVAVALPIGNPFLRALAGRIDLRNHRKIVIIDGRITYCGSQNCADAEFRVKAKYAPWVDAVIRFEGPIARQNQRLFASDWMSSVDEDLNHLLKNPIPAPQPGFAAQVIGTGPTVRCSALPEMFESLIYAARHELVISTPYYVPNESTQAALCAAAYRGIATTLVVPRRNDSWVVAAASRSYYSELLAAGLRIHEYVGGLLHTKSMTIDREVTLFGSANMDRRSFDLNYENHILFVDPRLTSDVRQRQQEYIDKSTEVTTDVVKSWTKPRRLLNNTVAILGPVL